MWEYFFGFRDDRAAEVARKFLLASDRLLRWRIRCDTPTSFRQTYFDSPDLILTLRGLEFTISTDEHKGTGILELRKRYRDDQGWPHLDILESQVVTDDMRTATNCIGILERFAQKLDPEIASKRMDHILDLRIERTHMRLCDESTVVASLTLDQIGRIERADGPPANLGYEMALVSENDVFREHYEIEEYFVSVFNVVRLEGTRCQRLRKLIRASRSQQPRKVMLDSDPGADDALAIMLAMNSPEIEVVGVTISHGNVHAEQGARNCAATFNALRDWVTPRYSVLPPIGVSTAQRVTLPDVVENLMGSDGFSGKSEKYFDPLIPIELDADVLFRTVMEAHDPGTVSLVVTGPMTNLAHWIQCRPDLVARLDDIVCMGGAVFDPGNVSACSEFNVFQDPPAARRVVEFCRNPTASGDTSSRAPLALTFVGLDITHKIQLTQDDIADIREKLTDDRLVNFVEDITSSYADFYWQFYRIHGICLHDVAAVACMIDPSLGAFQEIHMEVEDIGRFTSGMVVADLRPSEVLVNPQKERTAVCYRFDEARFRRQYLGRIFGLDSALSSFACTS